MAILVKHLVPALVFLFFFVTSIQNVLVKIDRTWF